MYVFVQLKTTINTELITNTKDNLMHSLKHLVPPKHKPIWVYSWSGIKGIASVQRNTVHCPAAPAVCPPKQMKKKNEKWSIYAEYMNHIFVMYVNQSTHLTIPVPPPCHHHLNHRSYSQTMHHSDAAAAKLIKQSCQAAARRKDFSHTQAWAPCIPLR